jgi:hypothetical protein
MPHRQGCFFLKGQNRFLPAGRGRSCHRLTVKVVFLRGQNRFLPAGRGRSCHRLTTKGRPEEVTSLLQQHVNADNISRHFYFFFSSKLMSVDSRVQRGQHNITNRQD